MLDVNTHENMLEPLVTQPKTAPRPTRQPRIYTGRRKKKPNNSSRESRGSVVMAERQTGRVEGSLIAEEPLEVDTGFGSYSYLHSVD